jgi:hypothetical protein
MSTPEDEPEIILEVCVDSVESAKAYVAICRPSALCKHQGIPRLMLPQCCGWRCPTSGTVRVISLRRRCHPEYGTRQGDQASVP